MGVAVVVAVFLSNIPESLSASAGCAPTAARCATCSGLWAAVLVASTLSAGLGFVVLGSAPPLAIAVTQAFAAGAILTMLADTMVPEAVEHAGSLVGLVTALGFTFAFLLSMA